MSDISTWLRRQADLDETDCMPQSSQRHREAADEVERLQAKVKRLQAVRDTAAVAISTCQAGMVPLARDGVHSSTFSSASDQFTAAWRDLKQAVEAAEEE